MNKKLLSFGALALLYTIGTAQSSEAVQQDSMNLQQLDEVVVSDSRFELKRENSGKTVIKITTEELERNQGRTVAQIINTKSGIEIAGSRGRDGGVLGVFARGGRGRQVLVIIDGIRVSDPSSFSPQYDLRLLATSSIASIEIIKGAASTLYGTNAATAVINITTKQSSKEKISGDFQSTIGTNQTAADQNFNASSFNNNALVHGTLNKFNYSIGISNRYSDGLSAAVTPTNEEDVFSQYSTDVRFGYRFSDKFQISVFGNKTKFDTEFDAALAEAPNRFKQDQERVGLSSTIGYGNNGSIQLNASYADYTSDSKSSFGESLVDGKNFVVDVYNKYIIGEKWHTILGVNYIEDKAVFSENVSFTILDPYANLVFVSGTGFNLNTGVRLNTHSEYGNHVVYNINPSYALSTDTGYVKVLGSFATSYITPNLTQLFGDFGANPDLEPEENRTIEGGIEYAVTDKFRLSAVYFNRNEKNRFGFDQDFRTINIFDEIDATGVEMELSWQPVKKVNIEANYTFTERKGDNAIRIPKHKVNALFNYEFSDRTNASLSYSYTGDRIDSDFSVFPSIDLELASFSLVNLYVEHQLIPKKLKVFLSADNILNEEFVEVLGFTTRGRNINAGFNLKL
ncbi:TonB-dependent receptor plug domain-containing protein [Maribacter sp. 2210JD10-5]|uniref:TonB-dependent receptor plug domain-containing protein n=1 Tax=Maribacter sp. 2210JD10-5 TaxID=3386272 RepID=UPI0039BC35BC